MEDWLRYVPSYIRITFRYFKVAKYQDVNSWKLTKIQDLTDPVRCEMVIAGRRHQHKSPCGYSSITDRN